MAILVVRIEDVSTLLMNEFFDYNGRCYALTRSRKENTDVCINLEDFYEGTVQSESLEDIPVVFVGSTGNSTGNHLHFEVWVSGERTDAMSFFSGN